MSFSFTESLVRHREFIWILWLGVIGSNMPARPLRDRHDLDWWIVIPELVVLLGLALWTVGHLRRFPSSRRTPELGIYLTYCLATLVLVSVVNTQGVIALSLVVAYILYSVRVERGLDEVPSVPSDS